MNSFRGICMGMIEALRLDTSFKKFITKTLKNQFDDFIDIISFIRNVLSHNIHADMFLSKQDYEGTIKKILRKNRNPNIQFCK
jgi:hypothetical protein